MPPRRFTTRRVARRARFGVALAMFNAPQPLAALYAGTDKVAHGYLPHYRTHFGPRRFKRNLLVEIGVGGYDSSSPGGSLAVWRDYLPRSTIVGLDLHAKRVRLGQRVHFMQANQNDVADLAQVLERHGQPDIVIDDGSHVGEHIITSFRFLWPVLQPGGLYVIEDLSTSYYPSFGGDNPAPPTTGIGLLQSLVESVQAQDPTFVEHPEWGDRPIPVDRGVAAVHVYPGIAFIEKASCGV
jgi:Methyltransferase domain